MNGFLKSIAAGIDSNCKAFKIKKIGCRITLQGAPKQRLIVDMDKLCSNLNYRNSCCDYLFFSTSDNNLNWFVPMELKRGKLHTGKVKNQLQGGATIAEQYVCSNQTLRFVPAIVVGSVHIAERKSLLKNHNKVRFHGRRRHIRLFKCNDPISKVLAS